MMENIGSPILTQTAATAAKPENDGISWWFKFMAKGVGVVGGVVAMVAGIMTCISLTPACMFGGILQVCLGFTTVVFEGPCCCPFLDFISQIGKFSDNRPHWQKAVFYTIISLIPIVMCFSLSTVFGCSLVFVSGVLYGMMALGKKADRSEMMEKARQDVEMTGTLLEHAEKNPELVNSIQNLPR
ncbi:calcium channel flower homolog [Argonauta hians]